MSYFVSAAELRTELDSGSGPVLLDLRYDPGKGSAPERFENAHLPGAQFVRLEEVFADPDADGGGNAPLPRPEELEQALRDLGLSAASDVVVYDDTSGGPAARAWWVLTWAGAQNVRVLDGGLKSWTAAGGKTVDGPSAAATPGVFDVVPGGLPHYDVDDVARLIESDSPVLLIDTRGAPQFSGEAGKPRTGHIPRARNVPQSTLTTSDGLARSRDEVTAVISGLRAGDEDIVAYCGAGVSSAYSVLVLAESGIVATLYPGSFSDWVSDPNRPVAQV